MADLSQFTSTGTTYDFSKGPKSIYYAEGDEDLFGLILNVPQTDDDDEWGGTERIAIERITDKIGSLEEIVSDPHGSGTDGLVNRVTALEVIVDTSTPKITLGNIVLNGSTDQITIGSTTTLTATDLTLGTNFSITEDNPVSYLMSYKDISVYLTDTGVTKQYQITVGGTSYIFTDTGLTLSSLNLNGDLTVVGDITGTNGIFSGNVHGATICGDDVSTFNHLTINGDITGDVTPWTSAAYNVGNPAKRWLGIAGTTLNISGASTLTGAVSIGSIFSDILPSVTATYNIGETTTPLRFNGIAAVTLNLSGNITAVDLNVNDINCGDVLMNDLIVNDVTISGTTITIDGAVMASNADIVVTGANISSNQSVQGAVLSTTTVVSLFTTTEPSTPVSQALLYYRAGGGSDTSVFLKIPGGTVYEIKSV